MKKGPPHRSAHRDNGGARRKRVYRGAPTRTHPLGIRTPRVWAIAAVLAGCNQTPVPSTARGLLSTRLIQARTSRGWRGLVRVLLGSVHLRSARR